MAGSIANNVRISRLAAAAVAVIVVLGLIAPPGAATAPVPRPTHVAAIQLQSFAAPNAAASTPQANASGPTPQNVLEAVAAIALTPLWYAAFPVTIPGSIAFAFFLGVFVSGIGGFVKPVDAAAILGLGLGIYALGPLTYISTKLSALNPRTTSAAATGDSRPAAAPRMSTTVSRPPHPTSSGLAGSRRNATPTNSVRSAAPAHRTAKSTPTASAEKRRAGTAGSARPVNKP